MFPCLKFVIPIIFHIYIKFSKLCRFECYRLIGGKYFFISVLQPKQTSFKPANCC